MNKRKASFERYSIQKYFKPSSNERQESIPIPLSSAFISANLEVLSESFASVQTDPANGLNIYEFNKKPTQPIIQFPKNKDGRKFVASWYKDHTWLEYSIFKDICYM